MLRRLAKFIVIGLVVFGATPTVASESWTCFPASSYTGEEFPNSQTTYTVNGDMLTPSRGAYYPKILINDDTILIAYWVFKVDGKRRAKNIGVVEVDEPNVIYLVFDKARNRLLRLDAMSIALFSDEQRAGSKPTDPKIEWRPDLKSERCIKNQ
jgi:hypothetical protein